MTTNETESMRRRNASIAAKRAALTENLKRTQSERDASWRSPTQALADRLIAESDAIPSPIADPETTPIPAQSMADLIHEGKLPLSDLYDDNEIPDASFGIAGLY